MLAACPHRQEVRQSTKHRSPHHANVNIMHSVLFLSSAARKERTKDFALFNLFIDLQVLRLRLPLVLVTYKKKPQKKPKENKNNQKTNNVIKNQRQRPGVWF